jgi:hypothetical protein
MSIKLGVKQNSFVAIFYLLVCSCFSVNTNALAEGRVFYVDSFSGDDSNSGLSVDQAWKSLAKVNSTVFEASDKILFKAGSRFKGQFKPQGSGELRNGYPVPILVDIYGQGEKPRIDAEGEFEATLYIHNIEYWEFNNLELTNLGPEPKPKRKGVYVHIEDFGTANHIRLKNLYIHDVNGTCRKRDGASGGIRWQTRGEKKRSRLNGLLVENCRIVRCERDGIMGAGHIGRGKDWYPSLNVVIRNNLIEEVPGDGIVPIACDGALVEYNVMRNSTRMLPQGDAAAGIWPWASDNTVIQFNEVSDHKAPWDAQGFDSDWNCSNTLIQYNYSHDNEGGFLLVCNNGGAAPNMAINTGTVVRYNVSINDGFRQQKANNRDFSPIFHISGPVKNTKIYNNVIFVPDQFDPDPTMIKMDNWGGPWPEDTWFANNIFYVEGEIGYDWGQSQNHWFEHNLFYGKHENGPSDQGRLQGDPLFVSPEPVSGLEAFQGFMLQDGSPCIKAGIPISPNGGVDLFGNKLRRGTNPSIGVHEFEK